MDARHRARPLVEIVKYRFFFLTTRADKNTRLLMYSIYPRIRRSTKRTSNVIFLSLVPVKKRSIEFSKKTTIKHWLGSNYAAISRVHPSSRASSFLHEDESFGKGVDIVIMTTGGGETCSSGYDSDRCSIG